jgi:hypothetical protein
MSSHETDFKKLSSLKNNEHCYFNMFQDGGAVCYKCNNMYLLFEIPLYGGKEMYFKTYFENQINDLILEAYSWT